MRGWPPDVPEPMRELATANSPRKPRRSLALSQLVNAVRRSTPMFTLLGLALVPICVEVPEPSWSRYWWTSKAKLFPGSTMSSMAAALERPSASALFQVQAPVQRLPGTRMRLLAPALRMAAMAALAEPTHWSVLTLAGSFMRLNRTRGLDLY